MECLALREEVEHLNEKQEVLAILMEGKTSMQKIAPEKCQEKIFEKLKELEEQKTRQALELAQRKHKLKWKWMMPSLKNLVLKSKVRKGK